MSQEKSHGWSPSKGTDLPIHQCPSNTAAIINALFPSLHYFECSLSWLKRSMWKHVSKLYNKAQITYHKACLLSYTCRPFFRALKISNGSCLPRSLRHLREEEHDSWELLAREHVTIDSLEVCLELFHSDSKSVRIYCEE